MVNTEGGILALAAGWIALFFVIRVKQTYFLDSRFFIAMANIAFNVILIQDLISRLTNSPPSQFVFVTMIALTTISIGFASYLLERNKGGYGLPELWKFLSGPPKAFLLYLIVVLAWTFSGIVFQPWTPLSLGPQSVFYFDYSLWYLALSSIVLVAFLGLPVAAMYRQSRGLSDSRASRSLKIISLSWVGFGLVTFFQVSSPTTALFLQNIGVVTESLLFMMIAFALREPTVLSRIISARPTQSRQPSFSSQGADTILIYNMESDRNKLVESFIRGELEAGRKAACFVGKDETPLYTAIASGIKGSAEPDVGGGILIQPMETMLNATVDRIESSYSDIESELIDLDELGIAQSRLIIEKAKAFDAINSPRKKSRIWAINAESAHPPILSMIKELDPKTRTIDQARHQDSFSSLLNIKHEDIISSRILVEYAPSSSYETLVQKFVDEFQANVEPVVVFTSVGTPIHKEFRKQPEVRLFSFSNKTSTPSKGLGEEVLLPERDSSLLLDAVDKLLQSSHGQRIALTFDVFSDLILLQGFDKTYGVLSSIVEMTESESVTVLVLLNYQAHDERVLNGVRGLFSSLITYDQDGVRTIRLQDPSSRRGRDSEGSSYDESPLRGVTGQ